MFEASGVSFAPGDFAGISFVEEFFHRREALDMRGVCASAAWHGERKGLERSKNSPSVTHSVGIINPSPTVSLLSSNKLMP